MGTDETGKNELARACRAAEEAFAESGHDPMGAESWDQLRARISALEAENADLRQQVEKLTEENAALKRADEDARKLCYDLAARLGNAGHRATTAESQLAAEREAVRVLGELAQSRVMWEVAQRMGVGQEAVETIISRFTRLWKAMDAVKENPIAAAAIANDQAGGPGKGESA